MQSPQKVPSPMHIAAPQTPPLHWAEQHWAALVHMVPSGLHAFVHVPLAQVPEQQSEKAVHVPPLGTHIGGPQTPSVLHGPEQQGSTPHVSPLGRQLGTLQMPPTQEPLQQGSVVLHATPLGTQIDGPQTWPLHWSEQQSVGSLQGAPSGWQTSGPQLPMLLHSVQHARVGLHCDPSGRHITGWHAPLTQAPGLQQVGPPGKHGEPMGRQGPPPQVPLMHGALQQTAPGKLHEAPSGSHIWPPQVPLTHCSPQQLAPGKLHGAPGGRHIQAPQRPAVHSLLQHWLGLEHGVPSASQAHASPQMLPASLTQMLSQRVSQQYGSVVQILATHGSHTGASLGPCVHSGWLHVPTAPQTPPLHWAVQHCAAELHDVPSGWQVPGPQMPVGPQPLQQGSAPHGTPSGRHIIGLLQTPLTQALLQQGVWDEQGLKSGRQVGAPQTPLIPQVPVQHCEALVQGLPSGSHIGIWAHTPPLQMLVQQSVAAVHAAPTGLHAPPQTPPLQMPSQHAEASVQLAPAGLHVPPSLPPIPPLPPPPGGLRDPRSLRPQLASREIPPSSVAITAKNQA